ncbi:STAS domain-containing protein [Streptacidiphilus sp. PB12-B1b]|uniref:STAS domain-containing protein n=1 Tax=Streptacidiphilus sp. PB12-B1b TaxID=2705012 RepID=UPI0015FCCA97|nr:STAS domain-containing protein [Streptacidiphilus sp. PB12-B1b]QMU77186.1 STAS domain-containing protein [Streptacidiphilus sp. PB12-B1b]
MTTELTLTAGHNAAGPTLALAGELDHDSAEQFRTAMDATALRSGQVLTVDLSDLTFCDSSGITALIAARRHALAHGTELTLAHVPPRTMRVLNLLGLDQFFTIHPALGADSGPA